MPSSREIVISERASDRVAAARAWLEAQPAASEVLVIASVKEAADDLVRAFAVSRGAMLGVHRLTLNRLVGLLAAEELADAGLAPADGLAAEAVAARAVFRLTPSGALAHFDSVLNLPGFSRALARTLIELRWNDIAVDELRALGGAGEAIAATLAQFDTELADARLIDRAGMLKVATRAVLASEPPRFVGLPILLLDVSVDCMLDRDFIAALAARAPSILATIPAGDSPVQTLLEDALGVRATASSSTVNESAAPSLARLQTHLFADTAPPERDVDETVTVISAPGEMHECVEIARRIVSRRGAACRSIESRCCCTTLFATRRICRKHSRARKSRPTSRAGRGGPSQAVERCSRCFAAPRKIFRRAASRNIFRSRKCPTPIARMTMSRRSAPTRNSRRRRSSRILKSRATPRTTLRVIAMFPIRFL